MWAQVCGINFFFIKTIKDTSNDFIIHIYLKGRRILSASQVEGRETTLSFKQESGTGITCE